MTEKIIKTMTPEKEKELRETIDWKPFKAQEEIIKAFDDKRHIRLAAGTRFGKSALCGYLCLRELIKSDNRIWIVAPSYDLTEKVWTYLKKFISKAAPGLSKGIGGRPPKVESPTGSFVACKSADPSSESSLLGEELDLVIVDEAAKMKQRIWDEYLQDRLSTRQGKSVFISTPWGKNWFYEEWMKAKEREDSAAFQFPTLENPYFPADEWEKLKNTKETELFNQNYKAMFIEGAAQAFKQSDIEKIINKNALKDCEPNHFYVMGVDIGKHQDSTVITVIDRYTNRVVYLEHFEKIHYPYQKKRIEAVSRRYNDARIIIDSTGVGEPVYDDLNDEGLMIDDFKFTSSSKRKLIDKLRMFIQEQNIVIPDDEDLLDELSAYSYDLTPSGNVKYSAPSGLHDDFVDSLALAVWGIIADTPPPKNAKEEMLKKMKGNSESLI